MTSNHHTARFWVYHGGYVRYYGYHDLHGYDDNYGEPKKELAGGWVKLSLGVGESITVRTGGPHSEGYSYSYRVYTYRNGKVYCESTTRAKDCDGPLDTYIDTVASINSLHKPKHFDDAPPEVQVLQFEKLRHRQRDYYAEAMGY